jgi:hypothetical protein
MAESTELHGNRAQQAARLWLANGVAVKHIRDPWEWKGASGRGEDSSRGSFSTPKDPFLRRPTEAAIRPRCKCRPRLRYTNDLDGLRLRARAFS